MKTSQWITLFILITLLLIPQATFAGANDLYIKSFSPKEGTLEEGESFTLTLDVVNQSGQILNDVSLVLDTDHFTPADGRTTLRLDDFPVGQEREEDVELIPKGTGTTLTFSFQGNAGGTAFTSSEKLILPVEVRSSDSGGSSDPIDKEAYTPEVHLKTERLVLQAGEEAQVEIALENKAANYARDLTIELLNTEDMKIFDVDFDVLRRLRGHDEETLEGRIRVMTTAKDQLYKVPIRLSYKNAFGIDKSRESLLEIRVENDQVLPTVAIHQLLSPRKALRAGAEESLAIQVKNHGTLQARDVKVKLGGLGEGLRMSKDVSEKSLGHLAQNEMNTGLFQLKVEPFAQGGVRTLAVTFTYHDIDGNTYERQEEVDVYIDGFDENTLQWVEERVPSTVSVGSDFELEILLKNPTDHLLEDVKLHVETPAGFTPLTSPTSDPVDLGSGEEYRVNYKVRVKEDVATDYYPLPVTASYRLPMSREGVEVQKNLGVAVHGGSDLGRPKLIIEDYAFEGETVQAGEIFDLTLQVRNTSDAERVKNIKLSFEPEEGIFDPVDSANAIFISGIERSSVETVTMRFKAKNNAQVKGYGLEITMAYENAEGAAYDDEGNPFSETDKITIPVTQPIRLETSDVVLPMESFVGVPGEIQLDFYNMGKAAMYNMMVKLTGDFAIQESNYFVGNFDAGASDYYLGTVIPESPGAKEGKVIFTFEDSQGNVDTVEVPFTLMVSEMQEMPMGPEGPMEPGMEGPGGMPPEGMEGEESGGPWVALLVGAFLLGALVLWRKKKKKKREALLMEEDDDL